jgi:4-amino-4-deoxy-L-arabinose transferase-like glycosyltransferase
MASNKTQGAPPAIRQLWFLQFALAGAIALTAGILVFANLGRYSDSYDNGVYLESARLLTRGHTMYHEVFDSQPPLWLAIVSLSFHFFGESERSGQLVTATSHVLLIIAVMLAAAQLRGWHAALLSGLVLTLSPVELTWSRVVIAEMPSTACAAMSIALAARYANSGRRDWLALSSIALACGVFIKLFAFYVMPALGLLIVARWWRRDDVNWRRGVQGVAFDSGMLLVAPFAVVLASAMLFDRAALWDQVVRFHQAARVAHPVIPVRDSLLLIRNLYERDPLLLTVAPIALLCVTGGWRGFAALIWVAASLAGLVAQRPLFDHHGGVLVPAVALAAGVGWGQCGSWAGALLGWARSRTIPTRVVAEAAGVASVALGLLLVIPLGQPALQSAGESRRIAFQDATQSDDVRMAMVLAQRTQSNDVVLTDAQGVAFWAHRDVPPGLTDTSFVRIASQYLTAQQVIEESESANTRAVLFWTGRLNQFPEVVAWARRRFPLHESFGEGQEIYWR